MSVQDEECTADRLEYWGTQYLDIVWNSTGQKKEEKNCYATNISFAPSKQFTLYKERCDNVFYFLRESNFDFNIFFFLCTYDEGKIMDIIFSTFDI